MSKTSSFFSLMLTVVMKCHPVLKMNVQRKIGKICYHHLKMETRRSVKVSQMIWIAVKMKQLLTEIVIRGVVSMKTLSGKRFLDFFDVLSL